MTIGQRAVECIKKRADENGTSFKHQADLLDTSWNTIKNWTVGKVSPGSYFLAEMYKQGYDIMYILTGERK